MGYEKKETKICKHCKMEIPFGAKVCPHCRKKQRANGCLISILIVLAIGLVGSCFAGGNDDTISEAPTVQENLSTEVSSTETKNTETTNEETTNEETTVEETTMEETTLAETKEEFIASCQEIAYKTLARNPDDYIGTRIVLTVKIEQIIQGGLFDDSQYYRVYTNDEYDLWMGDEYFMYDFRIDDDTKILGDDVWKVYAEFAGTETVTRTLTNTNEDVPAIKVYYAELISE